MFVANFSRALPICGMVSIILRVDLLGNTVVDWICKLSYFRLDTLNLGMLLLTLIRQGVTKASLQLYHGFIPTK